MDDINYETHRQVAILLNNSLIEVMPNFTNGLPPCDLCHQHSKDPTYMVYNLVVIGCVLPMIGLLGLVGNGLSAFTYSRHEMRSSTNIYLCALACSDSAVILTGIFIFSADSIRRYSLTLNTLFAALSPVLYPMGLTAQTCSVYFTVVAGADCFVRVCLHRRHTSMLENAQFVRSIIIMVALCSILYNIPHCFEGIVLDCFHHEYNDPSLEVCPAPLRYDEVYNLIYYKLMYTIFLAVGPLVVLIILNSFIIGFSVFGKGDDNSGENISLILVVLLFIACNAVALFLNMFEEHLSNWLGPDLNYVIDLSNLLVVFNSSFNFVIYLKFSTEFRHTLSKYLRGREKIKRTDGCGVPIVVADKNATKVCNEMMGKMMRTSQQEVLI